MRRLWLIGVLLATLPGCGDDPADTSDHTRFEAILTTPYSNMRESARLVISDSMSWAQIWAVIVTGEVNPAKLPPVDFRSEQVIVAALGERKRAGYAIKVEQMAEASGARNFTVVETAPGTTCSSAEVITTPLDAVIVNKSSLPARFTERMVIRDC